MIGHNGAPLVVLDDLDVFARLRAACQAAGGQKAWAEAHGMPAQYVCDVLACRRPIGPAILKALGLVVRYVEKGIGATRKAA
jgi:hypothetical protein